MSHTFRLSDKETITTTTRIRSCLSNKGYSILKNGAMSATDLKKLKVRLTATAKAFPGVYSPGYPLYTEKEKVIIIPRFLGHSVFGPASKTKWNTPEPFNASITFSASIRDNQVIPIQKTLERLNSHGGAVMALATGKGKTASALYIASVIKLKTIVIVHTEFLIDQWTERINKFLPEARVGRIQGKIKVIDDVDIVIATVQTVSMKAFDKDTFKTFGLGIFDETHHYAAETFHLAVKKLQCEYMLGLSATPERPDTLEWVVYAFIGDIAFRSETETRKALVHQYILNKTTFINRTFDHNGMTCTPALLTDQVTDTIRTGIIVAELYHILQDPKRIMIGMAHRKELLISIRDGLVALGYSDIGMYMGNCKDVKYTKKNRTAEFKNALTKRLILGTYALLKEALDCDKLNAVAILQSDLNPAQTVGRIFRLEETIVRDPVPLIIDFADNYSSFKKHVVSRQKYYKESGWSGWSVTYLDAERVSEGPTDFGKTRSKQGRSSKKSVIPSSNAFLDVESD